MIIRGDAELAKFRLEQLDGVKLLGLMSNAQDRAVGVSLPVGVGKSFAIDNLIETIIVSGAFDLVICMAPTHNILNERRWVKDPPREIKVVVLRPRPSGACGEARNNEWLGYDKSRCYQLGKRNICTGCPEKKNCYWPDQFKKTVKDAQVIFGAQAHLSRANDFIQFLVKRTGAKNPAVILDEDHACLTNYRRKVNPILLAQYRNIVAAIGGNGLESYVYKTGLLLVAPTSDLRSWDWSFPPLDPGIQICIQEAGYRKHGVQFRDLGFALQEFGRSPLASREKNMACEILYAAPPLIDHDLFLFTANNQRRLLEFRLGRPISLPFEGYTFSHPGSSFHNIKRYLGAKCYFPRNAKEILDFFARLAASRISQGRRVLLVSKKVSKPFCVAQLQARFDALGHEHITVIGEGYDRAALDNPHVIPIIHYGMVGVNDFASYDAVYCLNSFYIHAGLLDGVLQDVLGADGRVDLEIRHRRGAGRSAGTKHDRDRVYDVDALSGQALKALERDTVIQAVGRVRPFTKPREVITFQADDMAEVMPGVVDFKNLAEARAHFGIELPSKEKLARRADEVRAMRAAGLRQRQVAEQLHVTVRTVQRYWNQPAEQMPRMDGGL